MTWRGAEGLEGAPWLPTVARDGGGGAAQVELEREEHDGRRGAG